MKKKTCHIKAAESERFFKKIRNNKLHVTLKVKYSYTASHENIMVDRNTK